MEASSKTDLAIRLREQGYIPTLVKENENSHTDSFLSKFGFVSGADKIMFAKNLGSDAFLPDCLLTRALEILSRQTSSRFFSRTIISLMNDARKGDF